jgi:isoleucyl-tRNA synthetase
MPIEVEVGKEYRAKGQHPDRLELRKSCREYAAKWVGIQKSEFERLGTWGDWDKPYLTMDPAFEAAILEAFAGLAAKGYIQRGLRSIHWCPTDRTALAEAEIEYHDDPSPSVYVMFPLRDAAGSPLAEYDGVTAVAWTTTPWTLPANRGLMVDPSATYAVVAAAGRRFLVAEARVQSVAAAAGWTSHSVLARVKGAELIGARFTAPWGNESIVVDGTPYVSLEDGTGLVHTAPVTARKTSPSASGAASKSHAPSTRRDGSPRTSSRSSAARCWMSTTTSSAGSASRACCSRIPASRTRIRTAGAAASPSSSARRSSGS